MKKNMVVYAHYFYPDVASTGQILTELVEGLQEDFNITVICVVPSYDGKVEERYTKKRFYEEQYQGVQVIRVRVPAFDKKNKISRIKNIVAYFINAIWATFKLKKQDIVFSISQPPILGGLLGLVGKIILKSKFVYNIQDFNPEQTMAVGYSKNKILLKVAMFLDKLSCKYSDLVIVVGRDMQETLKKRFQNKCVPNNIFINNWIDEQSIYPLERDNEKVIAFKKKYGLENKFIFMYSGNLGLYYDLENILKVIGEFKDYSEVAFVFIGEGTVKNKLIAYAEEHQLGNVYFIPYQPKEELIYSLNAADVHWVINAKGIKGVSVPSKLYGVMAAGKPVLGVLEEGSEARLIIEEARCGACVTPTDYQAVANTVKIFISGYLEEKNFVEKQRKYCLKYLSKSLSIQKYRKLYYYFKEQK